MILAVLHWTVAFAITQLVEVPIYLRAQRRFGVAFGASAITHPLVWFVVPAFWHGGSYVGMVLVAEVFAVVTEALWLRRFGVRHALAWSLVANAASVAVGLSLRALTGWV